MINNFSKSKEASWFVLISNQETNDLICMKRLAFKKISSKSLIALLPGDFNTKYQIMLMCDSYIGLDQIVLLDFNKVNQRIAEAKNSGNKS